MLYAISRRMSGRMSRTLKNWRAPGQERRRVILAFVGMCIPVLLGVWLLTSGVVGVIRPRLAITIGSLSLGAGMLVVVVWACLEIRLVFRVRNLLRRGRAICFECGYRIDNVGPTSENCPECGYSIEESKVRTEEWVHKNLRFCFWPFTLLEPRENDDGEPPT